MTRKHLEKHKVPFDTEPIDDNLNSLTINKSYAQRFEQRKREEETSKLEEAIKTKLRKVGFSEDEIKRKLSPLDHSDKEGSTNDEYDSSNTEDEDGELLTPALDAQILKVVGEIRSKVAHIYQPEVDLFDTTLVEQAEEEWQREQGKKQRPLYLGEYQTRRLLSNTTEEDQDTVRIDSYNKQQETLKANLSFEVDNAEDGEDLLIPRKRTEEEINQEDQQYRNFLLSHLNSNQAAKESMKSWFINKEKSETTEAHQTSPNEDDAFLIDYILNRGWIDKSRKRVPSYDQITKQEIEDASASDILEESLEDEATLQATEEFEARMNFRYEQPGALVIPSYPRQIDTSLRAQDTKRRDKRQATLERKKITKVREAEELKRLKNLKKTELLAKIDKIKATAGADAGKDSGKYNKEIQNGEDESLLMDLLEGDFDPVTFDAQMNKFLTKHTIQDDHHKPTFSDSEFEKEEEPRGVKKAKRALKKALKKRSSNNQIPSALLDELLKLDYEDKIEDLACRFHYQQTEPVSFGLGIDEMLKADDADLNAFVSLKKLAPYRPADKQTNDLRKYGNKRRIYAFRNNLMQKKAEEQEIEGKEDSELKK